MEKLRVNDTPVRTARNFLINNIEIILMIPKTCAYMWMIAMGLQLLF